MFLLNILNCDLLENITKYMSVTDIYHLKMTINEDKQFILDFYIEKKTNDLLSQIKMHENIIRKGAIDRKGNLFSILFYVSIDSKSNGINNNNIDFSKFLANSSSLTYNGIPVHFQIDNIPKSKLHYKERDNNRFSFYEIICFEHPILEFMRLIRFKCGYKSYSLPKIRINNMKTRFFSFNLGLCNFDELENCNKIDILINGKHVFNKSCTNNQYPSFLMYEVFQVKLQK